MYFLPWWVFFFYSIIPILFINAADVNDNTKSIIVNNEISNRDFMINEPSKQYKESVRDDEQGELAELADYDVNDDDDNDHLLVLVSDENDEELEANDDEPYEEEEINDINLRTNNLKLPLDDENSSTINYVSLKEELNNKQQHRRLKLMNKIKNGWKKIKRVFKRKPKRCHQHQHHHHHVYVHCRRSRPRRYY